MALVEREHNRLHVQLIYLGPPQVGKSTCLEICRQSFSTSGPPAAPWHPSPRSMVFSLGAIRGVAIVCHLDVAPGEGDLRKELLRRADGVLFVADSRRAGLGATQASFARMRADLAQQHREFSAVPLVVQAHRRDGEDLVSLEELGAALGLGQAPLLETTEVRGMGALGALKTLLKKVLYELANPPAVPVEVPLEAPDEKSARALEAEAFQAQREGRYRDAERPLRAVVDFFTRHHGPRSLDTLNARMNLAVAHQRTGEAARAVPELEQIVATLQALPEPEARRLLGLARNNLGTAYLRTDRHADAQAVFEACLEALSGSGPSEERARALDHTAVALLDAGKPALAEPYARRGLAEWRALRPAEDVDIAISLGTVGSALLGQDRRGEARPLLTRALSIVESIERDHPRVIGALNLLGGLEYHDGRLAAARALFERAAALGRQRLGEGHPQTREALHGLAAVERAEREAPT